MGTLQEALAKLLRKPAYRQNVIPNQKAPEPSQEAASTEGMNEAEKLVNKISDDKAPGVIQRRKKRYEEIDKMTREQ